MYESTTLIDLLKEIVEEFDEDEQITDSILDDLSENISMVLYERRATISEMAVSIDDYDS